MEETYRKVETIDGESCLMNILDSSGQEEYASMRCSFMRCSQGFLCVYDVTSRHSLEELETFIQQFLLVHRQERYPMVIVGNKSDLTPPEANCSPEGQRMAQKYECPHHLSSAKTRLNVEEPLHQLIRRIRVYQEQHPPTRRPKGAPTPARS